MDEEVRLLHAANAALRHGRNAAAARGFNAHAERFPDGALVELREVGRASLRCRVHPTQRAEVIAAFTRRFSSSLHLPRVQRECGES